MAECENNENNLLREELVRHMRMREEGLYDKQYLLQKKLQINQQQLKYFKRIFVGASLLLFVYFLYYFLIATENSVNYTVARVATFLVAVAMIISLVMLIYLQSTPIPRVNSNTSKNNAQLRFYIDEQISDAFTRLKDKNQSTIDFSESDKATVLAKIQAKLESDALQTYVEGVRELVSSRVKEDALGKLFENIIERLGREVQDLAKRGNLNLILGIFTTLVGLLILGYSVFYSPVTQSPQELFAYFIPRISLVVLVEIFAYFFLRLYKQSLSEIKYFQNEITNIESRQLALHITMRDDDASLRSKVVEELSKTERNFLIGKDQTTVDLERERMARGTYSDVTNVIKDLLKRKSDD